MQSGKVCHNKAYGTMVVDLNSFVLIGLVQNFDEIVTQTISPTKGKKGKKNV